jgi:hypothetical protein
VLFAKTEELTKIFIRKIEVHQLERELSTLYEDIGRRVTKYAKEENMVNFSGNQEFFNFVEKNDKIQSKMDSKTAHIRDIKEEYNISESEVDLVIEKPNIDIQNREETEIENENISESYTDEEQV